jgi:ankyrin repeat protein
MNNFFRFCFENKRNKKDMAAGSETEMRAILDAVSAGDCAKLRELHAAGVDLKQRSSDRMTAMHWAASLRFDNVIKCLHSLDRTLVNETTGLSSPLETVLGQPNSTKDLLLSLGAKGRRDPNRCDTFFHHVAETNDIEIFKLLAPTQKHRIDIEDYRGLRPIDVALRFGHLELVELFKLNGARAPMSRDGVIWTIKKKGYQYKRTTVPAYITRETETMK